MSISDPGVGRRASERVPASIPAGAGMDPRRLGLCETTTWFPLDCRMVRQRRLTSSFRLDSP